MPPEARAYVEVDLSLGPKCREHRFRQDTDVFTASTDGPVTDEAKKCAAFFRNHYQDASRVFLRADPGETTQSRRRRGASTRIVRGRVAATPNAIVGGLVMVDDIAQIMCFKMAFKLERAVFDAYLASRPAS